METIEKVSLSSVDISEINSTTISLEYNAIKYKGYFYEEDGKYVIYFSKNSDFFKYINECAGKVTYLYAYYRNTLLKMKAEILNSSNNKVEILLLDDVCKIQNRNYLRVDTDVACFVNHHRGTIKNLSGGGARITFKNPDDIIGKFRIDEYVTIGFILKHVFFNNIKCVILSKSETDIRVEFVDMREREREKIIAYTLYKDIKNYKRKKHER